eukprot:TRINITY_DN125432_c0_g1_i1.p1 TRINITY_DN125432_c0_g1~~TRINITY_DN125432_c0_g1_i1.p1  ORF type:complete len:276 (-),score=54.67 TRINITY_DN125432_c0_g1_i1:37-864(-)
MHRCLCSAVLILLPRLVGAVSLLATEASSSDAGHLLRRGSQPQPVLTQTKQWYTTNNICLRRYCVNPVFPGLRMHRTNAFQANENRSWECVQNPKEWHDAEFCGRIIAGYQFAIPYLRPEDPVKSLQERMAEQKKAAVHAYVAHIAAMGHDFWDYTQPWEHDECIQSVWKMACYTHFPQCDQMRVGGYLRPCASTCETYINACGVECCDEGVQCVFEHQTVHPDGTVSKDDGYAAHNGPSPLCTGSARESSRPFASLVVAAAGLAAYCWTMAARP